ncbi:GNAT family N-acetyltransferase [uncultured Devosia sp.]|uniref:GNAT family N-acetyltransferase n=1 Tax=uncultured Devosia sp. TaxID=211434 RepID=UPI0035CA5691
MSIQFRAASETDLARLCALDTSAPTDPARGPQIAAWIAAGAAHVAIQNGVVAGYGVITHTFFHAGMIEMLMIAEPFRQHGLGTGLLAFLETLCRTDTLWSSTNLSNRGMQSLFERTGFVHSGLIEGLDEGDPEVIYRKRLR